MPLYPTTHGLPDLSGTSVETAGNIATITGTVITSHATVNTFGSWTQLLASTTKKAIAIVVEASQNSTNFGDFRLQIGVGANPNEVPIMNMVFAFRSSAGTPTKHGVAFCEIPAGSRISARLTSSGSALAVAVVIHLVEVD